MLGSLNAVLKGRVGEHAVASFLFSQGWYTTLVDAEGYDLLATFGRRILRIQVKTATAPVIGKRERAPGWYRWTVGMGGTKRLGNPSEHYEILALYAHGKNAITFVAASTINKKTYRIHPDTLTAETSKKTWLAALEVLQ